MPINWADFKVVTKFSPSSQQISTSERNLLEFALGSKIPRPRFFGIWLVAIIGALILGFLQLKPIDHILIILIPHPVFRTIAKMLILFFGIFVAGVILFQ